MNEVNRARLQATRPDKAANNEEDKNGEKVGSKHPIAAAEIDKKCWIAKEQQRERTKVE